MGHWDRRDELMGDRVMARNVWKVVFGATIGLAACWAVPDLSVRAEEASQAEEAAASGAETQPVRTLRLWIDGNLPGRVMQRDNGGVEVPARATISFRQDGEVLYQTRSDEGGYFQVVGVEPGIYSVVVSGPAGSAALMVEVLPYDAELFEELRLEIVLDQTAQPGEAAPPNPSPVPPMAMPPAAAGGGGGGLSALGVAAGVAGLAVGVVALATADEAEPLPTPFFP